MNTEEMHKNVERLDELDSHLDEARDILIVSLCYFQFSYNENLRIEKHSTYGLRSCHNLLLPQARTILAMA